LSLRAPELSGDLETVGGGERCEWYGRFSRNRLWYNCI